jgi:transcriptional regulator with XRE-family HTH domain
MLEAEMGKRLAARRRALGLTEVELAARAGTPDVRIAKWEAGKERIPARDLLTLAQVLQCNISYFFEGLPNIPRSKLRNYVRLIGGTEVDAPPEDGSDSE